MRLDFSGRPRAWAGLLLLALTAACAVNPVTGRRQLSLVSEAQEVELGRQAAAQAVESIGLVPDSALQAYVQRVGAGLAARSERPALPWTFRVVDDPTPNAFALPGGFIFVTRGMMALMSSEAELASVLGHEIGHVTARHGVSQVSRAQLAQLGLGIGSILSPQVEQLGGVASGGLNLLFLHYGRDAERQADELGFRYALGLGYDVREMADVFATLARVGEGEGRSPLPTWLASHPGAAERVAATRARVAALPPGTTGRAEAEPYLRRIDGMVYGEDPRQGFFEEGVFLHPELRFRVDFPAGWRTQNLPRAVSAAAPRGDAAMQLTLAEVQGRDQAAQRFLAAQGIRPGRVTRETLNGLSATVAYFQANTQQGVLTGIAAFVEHGGRTFQLVAFAPDPVFGAYDAVFRRTVGSFAPLVDPGVLAIQPRRVDVVRTERALTLTEFNRLHPSVIPLPELAILNQVADAAAVIPAGTRVKRVIRA